MGIKIKKLVHFLLHPGERLSQRIIHAGFWVFALRITDLLFGLMRIIVLARLLSPNDFGLFGIALLSLSALETFSQTGFQQALIQKKGDIRLFLDIAWTVQVIRGFVLAGILFGIAPYVVSFFGEPTATLLLRAFGLSAIFQGLTNIGVVYFQKELEFHKQFIYMFSGTLADLGVAIPAALILRNAWALVFGLLAGNFVRMVMSYFVYPYRPHPSFNEQQFKELFGFGKWILGSSILIFLLTQGDDIFVGKLLGATALGFYQMAYRISNMPATEITHVISQVTFPAYSKLQDNIPKLREAYLKVLQITAFLSFPIAGLIFVLAPDFTKIFLGEKWIPMVPAMQVLCIFGVTRSFGATTGPIFQGVGKPSILTKLAVIQLVMLIAIIYPLTNKFGIFGTAIAVVIPNIITQIIAGIQILNIIKCNTSKFIKPLLFPLLSTGIIVLIVAIFIDICKNVNIGVFSVLIIFGAIGYLGMSYLFGRKFDYNTMKILSQIIRPK